MDKKYIVHQNVNDDCLEGALNFMSDNGYEVINIATRKMKHPLKDAEINVYTVVYKKIEDK